VIIALMMGTETVPETLDLNELTRLSAREEFINFSRRESFTSYIPKNCLRSSSSVTDRAQWTTGKIKTKLVKDE
jgi:hypothetical protein